MFLISNNNILSEYIILFALAEAEMIVEIDYRGNPMETPNFQDTLYKLYGYDRINGTNYNKAGEKYVKLAQNIMKEINEGELGEIEDD